jgi:phospholipid/cholesterol/gamma-HCH transport system ATP-binding protein
MTTPAIAAASEPPILMENAAIVFGHSLQPIRIEGINWRVAGGDFWVIAGLHDSGKSRFLFTAAGMLVPWHGTCRLFGNETAKLSEDELVRERLRVGLVFENGGRLFQHLSVEQNVALPLCYHQDCDFAEAVDPVNQLLELTGLAEFSRETPSRLNPGWRQRVALARALILRPEVLLLDNPLAGMDPRHVRWWLDFLALLSAGHEWLRGQPMTVVVTTDDFQPWLELSHHFAALHQKQWRVLGTKADLTAHADPSLRELLPAVIR